MDGTTGPDVDGISKKDFFCTSLLNTSFVKDEQCPVSCGGCPPLPSSPPAAPQLQAPSAESCDDPTRKEQSCVDGTTGADPDGFCTGNVKVDLCPVSCGGCQAPSAEEATAIPVSADVTSAAAGHADFTFELIGGGVASVALLALLVFASRWVLREEPPAHGPASPA